MLGQFRSRLTYANVVATLALFFALGGGTAVALQGRNTVDSGDIRNQQVRSADVQNEAISSNDVRNGALVDDDIQNETLTNSDIANDTVGGDDIFEPSLGQVPSAANAQNIADGSVRAGKLGTMVTRQSTGVVPGGSVAENGSYVVSSAVTASCQGGEIAIGGRADWRLSLDDPDAELFLHAAGLSGVGNPPTSYYAQGGNDTGEDEILEVTVFCLAP